jgi:hypothetical protein
MRDYYIYHRPETGQDEKVTPERWVWECVFQDGTSLKQFDDSDGSFHQFREIPQDRLSVFRMVNYETGRFFDIQWHPSRKLIHFYNNNILENDTVRVRLYCFGYETFFEGASHTVLMVILPDDSLVVTEDIGRINIG